MREYIQVLTTTPSKEEALMIAGKLVQNRLAACIQVGGPIMSTYRWEEKIQEDEEWRLTIKTRRDLYKRIEKAIIEIHPYEIPEIISTPLIEGNPEYFEWMDKELT